MDRQVFIDRTLETENLTGNLEDEDADTLINWGIAQVNPLIEGIDDEETAAERIDHLMHLMRQINRIAGNPSSVSREEINKFIKQYAKTFGKDHHVSEEERQALAKKISSMSSSEAMNYLLEWMQSKTQ